MSEINLFGEKQDYPASGEDGSIADIIKEQIEPDYEEACESGLFDESMTFEKFYNNQKNHLIEHYKKCKNLQEFVETYSFKF